MQIETKQLVKVGTFARMKGVAAITVYKWIEQGKVDVVDIDGVKFVKLQEE